MPKRTWNGALQNGQHGFDRALETVEGFRLFGHLGTGARNRRRCMFHGVIMAHPRKREKSEKDMIKISLPYIYGLAGNLRALRSITDSTPIKDHLYTLYTADAALNSFLTESVYTSSLRATSASGMSLNGVIRTLLQVEELDRNPTFLEVYNLSNHLTEFETVLTAEMNVGHTYLVTRKRAFDTATLIDSAEQIFAPEFAARFPEAIADIRHAGRCIAFELATAAGFHIMRAAELVIRRYWDAVTKGKPRPDRFNIGDYLHEMEKLKVGDAKTLATLKQIKDLHRNELMHPEVSLDLDESICLLGIVQSVIVEMMKEIPGTQPMLPELIA